MRTREPVLYRGTYQPLSTRTQREDVLFLPLSQDGETVNMVMILGHIDWMKDETRSSVAFTAVDNRQLHYSVIPAGLGDPTSLPCDQRARPPRTRGWQGQALP